MLQNPHRLKILTIDALAASITRSQPILSGFGGNLEVSEDASPLYLKAAQDLLISLETDESIAASLEVLLLHLDNRLNSIAGLLAEMLSHREQWLPHVSGSLSNENTRFQLEQSLQFVVLDALANLLKHLPKDFGFILELMHFSRQQLRDKTEDSNELEKLNVILEQIEMIRIRINESETLSDLRYIDFWQDLAVLLLTEAGDLRKTVTVAHGFPPASGNEILKEMKSAMLECLENLSKEPAFIAALLEFRSCPPIRYTDSQWQLVEALLKLLPTLVAHLMVVFQEEGKVDFAEVSMAACRALGSLDNPTDLALSLDYKIRHLLVDEFQDTSIPQLRLLTHLMAGWQAGDGRSIFLVGDPMQSIYRFRQAEVGLFLKAKQYGIAGIPLTSLKLTDNFRSDPQIVEWNNEHFQDLFPEEDDLASGAISFHAMRAARIAEEGAEVVHYSVDVETEMERLKEILEELKSPESKALLVRSRSQLKDLLPKLRDSGIEYQAVEIEYLNQRPMIRDLLALSRSLVHLGDRIAWLALLRGPWCGLSLQDLYTIANHEPTLPIWWTLEQFSSSDWNLLSNPGKEAVSKFFPIMSKALANRARPSFVDWVLEPWLALMANNASNSTQASAEALEDAESFFTFLEEKQSNFNFSEIGVLDDCFQSLYAKPRSQNPNALQVLTVHKSKGLEFDTVILAGLGRSLRSDSEKLLLWEERPAKLKEPFLLVAPIKSASEYEDPIYTYLKKQNKKRMVYEEQRLLYVAMTRARKRLYCLNHD